MPAVFRGYKTINIHFKAKSHIQDTARIVFRGGTTVCRPRSVSKSSKSTNVRLNDLTRCYWSVQVKED
jgi:hypothetical protein